MNSVAVGRVPSFAIERRHYYRLPPLSIVFEKGPPGATDLGALTHLFCFLGFRLPCITATSGLRVPISVSLRQGPNVITFEVLHWGRVSGSTSEPFRIGGFSLHYPLTQRQVGGLDRP